MLNSRPASSPASAFLQNSYNPAPWIPAHIPDHYSQHHLHNHLQQQAYPSPIQQMHIQQHLQQQQQQFSSHSFTAGIIPNFEEKRGKRGSTLSSPDFVNYNGPVNLFPSLISFLIFFVHQTNLTQISTKPIKQVLHLPPSAHNETNSQMADYSPYGQPQNSQNSHQPQPITSQQQEFSPFGVFQLPPPPNPPPPPPPPPTFGLGSNSNIGQHHFGSFQQFPPPNDPAPPPPVTFENVNAQIPSDPTFLPLFVDYSNPGV